MLWCTVRELKMFHHRLVGIYLLERTRNDNFRASWVDSNLLITKLQVFLFLQFINSTSSDWERELVERLKRQSMSRLRDSVRFRVSSNGIFWALNEIINNTDLHGLNDSEWNSGIQPGATGEDDSKGKWSSLKESPGKWTILRIH